MLAGKYEGHAYSHLLAHHHHRVTGLVELCALICESCIVFIKFILVVVPIIICMNLDKPCKTGVVLFIFFTLLLMSCIFIFRDVLRSTFVKEMLLRH